MATTQTNVNKEVNQGILRDYLGIVDGSDIDFGTYKTLIREKIAAARMGGSDADSGDIEVLTKEFKRIKKINIPGSQAKPKIDAKKFFKEQEKAAKKIAEKSNDAAKKISSQKFIAAAATTSSQKKEKVKPQLLLPGTAEPQQEEGVNNEELIKGIDEVSLKLTDLDENLQSILDTLKKQAKLDKKEDKEEDALKVQQKRVSREKLLESKSQKEDKKITEKVVKPVKGIFDFLMDFIKNILLGGALLFLLKVLKDPKKFLQPLIDAFNKVLEFFNGIIRGINGFIDGFNEFVLTPINDFVLKPIHSSLNFIEDRINDVLKLFGQEPLENISDQPPSLEIPKIPEIPMYDPFKVRPENQQQAPPVQQTYQGGQVIYNSNSRITGAGADTQLIAAQPGEIVMSRGAVNKFGAGNLLAMNAAGGGNNTPRMTNNIQGFSGGGLVGGTAGSPRDPKNRKIFLHWSGGFHNSPSSKYHQIFSGSGKPLNPMVNYGIDKNSHTGGFNTDSIGIAAAAMGHRGMSNSYYDENKGWKENPLTTAQTNAMAKEAAGLMRAYGQTAADVNKNVMTHGEWERQAVKSGSLKPPVQRWDLDTLKAPPYSPHPGGFYSTQQVKSDGGNKMRSKIRSFLGGGGGAASGDTFTRPEGVSSANFTLLTAMGKESRQKILMSAVGDKVDGVTVTRELRGQANIYNLAKSDFDKIQIASSSATKSPVETGGASTATITTSQPRQAPGPRMVDNSIFMGPNTSGGPIVPKGATPTSVAGNANGIAGVPQFSSQDDLNTETLIIKSIYSLVG